jgi:hypothetical protein
MAAGDSSAAMNMLSHLKTLYPRLFVKGLPWDLSYGQGWHAVVVDLLAKIDAALTDEQAAEFRILQIKQKFAGLRLYYSAGQPIGGDGDASASTQSRFPHTLVRALIDEADQECKRTCELCGEAGKMLNDRGWLEVRCTSCEAKRSAA